MFHEDIHEQQKDTDEVPSIGEGQAMQPTDDQSLSQPPNRAPGSEQSGQEQASNGSASHIERAEERPAEGQVHSGAGQSISYRGVSEQIPFSYPPASTPVQPGTTPTPAPSGPSWMYPPRPEQYQRVPFGPQPPQAGASAAQPFGAPGQFNQPTSNMNAPFGQVYSTPTAPFAQANLLSTAQPGMGVAHPPKRPGSGPRTGAIIALIALLAAVFATGLFAGWQFGRDGGSASSPTSSSFQSGNSTVTVPQLTNNNAEAVREAVISKVQPGIVQIDVLTASQHALGSGVIIDARGYVVTNNHVVANASSIRVTLSDNRSFSAQVVGTDSADDLAVIKFTPPSSGVTTVTPGDSSQLRVGQDVLAIGSPLGNAETVTRGIISALNRNVSEGQGGATLPDAIQTDAPINPGNSGGALVDMKGNLIGMPTLNAIDTEFNTPANGLGFAIPSNRIKFIAEQIIANGHVTHTGRPILGVTVSDVDPTSAAQNHLSVTSGTLIVSVTASGPAATAGLKADDVITQVENSTINTTTDLSKVLLQHKPGDIVAVKVSRGNQQFTANVTLGELAAG